MEVRDQRQAPSIVTPDKKTRYPLNRKFMGLKLVWSVGKEKSLLLLPGFKPVTA